MSSRPRVPFEQGRELAALIPRSRLVTLDSQNHLLTPEESAWSSFLDEINRFLADP